MATEVRQIRVKADDETKGALSKIARDLSGVNKGVKDLSSSFGFLRNALVGMAGYFAVGRIVEFSDSMQLARNRITSFTGDAGITAQIMGQLNEAAKDIKAPIDSMAESFNRILISTKNLKMSYASTIGLTKTLGAAFLVSGSTTEEAINSTIQLTQSLAMGRFRMQEFNSVTSASPLLMEAFQKQTGKSAGELRKFVEEGKFGADLIVKSIQAMVDNVNKKAKEMPPTFQQTIVLAMNEAKKSVDSLNQAIGASELFGKGVGVIIANLNAVGAAIGVLALTQIPLLITKLGALVTIPFGGWLAIAAAGIVGLTVAAVNHAEKSKTFEGSIENLTRILNNHIEVRKKYEGDGSHTSPYIAGEISKLDGYISKTQAEIKKIEDTRDLSTRMAKILVLQNKGTLIEDPLEAFKKQLIELTKVLNDVEGKKVNATEVALKELNSRYEAGSISLQEYNKSLTEIYDNKAWDKFRDGKADLNKLREEQIKLGEANWGDVFYQGAMKYAEGIKSLQQAMSDFTTNTFTRIEDSLTELVRHGEWSFVKLRELIYDEMARIAVRMAMLNIIKGISSQDFSNGEKMNTSSDGSAFSNFAAKGNVFSKGNVTAFASGGIVNSPTMFGMSSGRTGLMGEKGAEAIMPLSRGSDGKLGVAGSQNPVIVNVINNAGADTTTSEREENGSKIIDIIIEKKTQEIFNSGKMDKPMKQLYGLNRKAV